MQPDRTPRILLINPPSNCVTDNRVEPPLGLMYIAATAIEQGFSNIEIHDMAYNQDEAGITDQINNVPFADVYGLSCLSTNYPYAKRVIAEARAQNPAAFIVLGGPHPSALPEETLRDSGADLVVKGEGEDVFCQAVKAYWDGVCPQGILIGSRRDDIDTYAFPARDLIDHLTYSRSLLGKPVACLLSSRGCSYHCIHCNSVVIGGKTGSVRYRSPQNILDEIRTLRGHFERFRFNDDHFTGNPRLHELLNRMKELNIKFRAFARIEDLDAVTCKLLKEAGCVMISLGLESLHPGNLEILGKRSQVGKEGNIKIAREHGITIRASFMVGLPYDTDLTINESFRRAADLDIDEIAIYPLIPYPGTVLWSHPERFGYEILDRDTGRYVQLGRDLRSAFVLSHKNFGPADVFRWRQTATEILEASGCLHVSRSRVI